MMPGFLGTARRIWLVVFSTAALIGLFLFFSNSNPFDVESRQLRQQEKLVREWEARYRNDTYGGKTPEETLQLFIDALKKGDTDLAAKYFVIDEQEKWQEYFKNADISRLIGEAQMLKLSKRDTSRAFFTIANDQNIVEVQVVLILSSNGIWKIVEI